MRDGERLRRGGSVREWQKKKNRTNREGEGRRETDRERKKAREDKHREKEREKEGERDREGDRADNECRRQHMVSVLGSTTWRCHFHL